MKQGIIYGGAFLFAFVIVTGLLIYLSSSFENIFQFNFAPKSFVQLSDSTSTDSLNVFQTGEPISELDSTIEQDSILLSSLGGVETIDSIKIDKTDSINVKKQNEILNNKKGNEKADLKNITTDLAINQPQIDKPVTQNIAQGKEYTEWVQKVTSIYAAMEPKKAAKIIQTYSDNVARDILYNMSKKTAAKVVSELSPETANRIFRFE
jgi:hypothetical protein